MSTDGRFVAFSSRAHACTCATCTTATDHHGVSHAGRGAGFEPAISADGARVAFTSTRSGRSRVLFHDRATGKTTAVTDGTGISFDPSLSGDGTRVAFASNRRDLAATRSAGARSVYVYDARAPAARRW